MHIKQQFLIRLEIKLTEEQEPELSPEDRLVTEVGVARMEVARMEAGAMHLIMLQLEARLEMDTNINMLTFIQQTQ